MSTRPILKKGGAVVAASALLSMMGATAAFADEPVDEPSSFSSMFTATATPEMVIDPDGEPSPGEEGAIGMFNFHVNSDEEIICYDIMLDGVTPPYESPARTATHIHEAEEGEAGPPRLAFPDPEEDDDGMLRSDGCMQGPFTTGVEDEETGEDTGEGFTLAQLEEDPAAFFADTHTADFADGAVRGQLEAAPEGGVETGAGMVDGNSTMTTATMATGVTAFVASLGLLLFALRRHASSKA